MIARLRALLAVLALALTGLVAGAAPASAHNSAWECSHTNHFHTLQPDIYFIGHGNYTRNGVYAHWHRYVHDPLVGTSWTVTQRCS